MYNKYGVFQKLQKNQGITLSRGGSVCVCVDEEEMIKNIDIFINLKVLTLF